MTSAATTAETAASSLPEDTTIEVLMPRAAPGAAAATIVRWHVAEGDHVAMGDLLADIAIPGATLEIEAMTGGRVDCILVPAGSAWVPVGTPIAILTATGPAPAEGEPAQATDTAPARVVPAAPASPRAAGDDGPEIILSFREALNSTFEAEMRRDARIVLIGASAAQNQGSTEVTAGLADAFGLERVIAASESPATLVGLAMGASRAGLLPVLGLDHGREALAALETIATAAMKARMGRLAGTAMPLVVRVVEGLGSGAGPAVVPPAASLCHIPGLIVAAPTSAREAMGLLRSALMADRPTVLLEDERFYAREASVPLDPDWRLPFGQARVARPGRHITLVAYGGAVSLALEAAEVLAGDHIAAEVIDLLSLRPLDTETILTSVHHTGRLLAIEEGWPFAGLGAEIVAHVAAHAFADLRAPPRRLSAADEFRAFAPNLELGSRPSLTHIVETARALASA